MTDGAAKADRRAGIKRQQSQQQCRVPEMHQHEMRS